MDKEKFRKQDHYTAEEWRKIHSGTAKEMDYLNQHIETMEQAYERHMTGNEHMLDQQSDRVSSK